MFCHFVTTKNLFTMLKFLAIVLILNFVECLDVGDDCMSNDLSQRGTCTPVSYCQAAIEALRRGMNHKFKRCGFTGIDEVVCCPTSTDKGGGELGNRISSQRITDRECKKILDGRFVALDSQIKGGESASEGEFPHQVALGYDRVGNGYEFDCGGSVLSRNYVLTAAHCIDTRTKPTIIRGGVVELGDKQWNPTTDVRIAEIILEPRYARKEKYHDLALLRLERPLEFSSSLYAVCLETSLDDPTEPLTVTGWGKTSNSRGNKSNVLLKATLKFVPRNICAGNYRNWLKLPDGISSEQICAGDPQGLKDTCSGDSGGPLQWVSAEGASRLVGVTSFGRGCGSVIPGVYTRVAPYLDWIESVVWPNQ